MVAFQEVVEEHVPAFRIHHPGADTPHEEEHRWALALLEHQRGHRHGQSIVGWR